jgi:hypothetical protein
VLYQNKNAANFWRCGFTSVGSLPMAKKQAQAIQACVAKIITFRLQINPNNWVLS